MSEMGPAGQEAGVSWEESRRSLLSVRPEQRPFTDREDCRSNSGGHVDGHADTRV